MFSHRKVQVCFRDKLQRFDLNCCLIDGGRYAFLEGRLGFLVFSVANVVSEFEFIYLYMMIIP